jgi:hypothetical protein
MDTINGFDPQKVWDLALEEGRARTDSDVQARAAQFTSDAVTPSFDGDGVQVLVPWTSPDGDSGVWAASFNGDPDAPTLRAFDIPHSGK